jgi:hypothetical protein
VQIHSQGSYHLTWRVLIAVFVTLLRNIRIWKVFQVFLEINRSQYVYLLIFRVIH